MLIVLIIAIVIGLGIHDLINDNILPWWAKVIILGGFFLIAFAF